MSPITKTAASLVCLAAVALANPINAGATRDFARRAESDCEAGKLFYVCANGYRGCFAEDPCALPPTSTTAPQPTTTTRPKCGGSKPTSTSTPTPSSTPAPACSAGSTDNVWEPTMYNLNRGDAEHAEDAVTPIQVSLSGDESLEQAVVFRGIPAGAKTCSLKWDQAAEDERNFTVDHSGFIGVLQLTGFPAEGEPVSYASVDPFVPKDKKPTHADFTFWDKQSKEATPHSVSPVDCAESVYLKIAIDPINGDGKVFMDQDKKNGFHIEYTC